MTDEIKWSDWLDFSYKQAEGVPETAGVYMMHAAMKILLIGGTDNLKRSIIEALGSPCTSEAKRFRYFETSSQSEIAKKLLDEYKEKHDGKLPRCME